MDAQRRRSCPRSWGRSAASAASSLRRPVRIRAPAGALHDPTAAEAAPERPPAGKRVARRNGATRAAVDRLGRLLRGRRRSQPRRGCERLPPAFRPFFAPLMAASHTAAGVPSTKGRRTHAAADSDWDEAADLDAIATGNQPLAGRTGRPDSARPPTRHGTRDREPVQKLGVRNPIRKIFDRDPGRAARAIPRLPRPAARAGRRREQRALFALAKSR